MYIVGAASGIGRVGKAVLRAGRRRVKTLACVRCSAGAFLLRTLKLGWIQRSGRGGCVVDRAGAKRCRCRTPAVCAPGNSRGAVGARVPVLEV